MNKLLRKGKSLPVTPAKRSTEDLQEYLFFMNHKFIPIGTKPILYYKKGQTIAFSEYYEVYGPGRSLWRVDAEIEHIWPGTWGY